MFDCRRLWGLQTFLEAERILRILCVLMVSGWRCVGTGAAQEPDVASEEPIAVEEEATSESPIDEAESSATVDDPNTEYGWDVIRKINPELRESGVADDANDGSADSPLFAEGEQTFQRAIFRMVFGLSIVLALIFFAYYLLRRFGKGVPALSGSQLGRVIGQMHLSRDATLHFVRTGGRVLVVGVNPNSVNLVAEFESSVFDGSPLTVDAQGSFDSDAFVNELREQTDAFSEPPSDSSEPTPGDNDVDMLRSDIQRLQEYLREETRESTD